MWPRGGRRGPCVSAPPRAGEAPMGVYQTKLGNGKVEAVSAVHDAGVTVTIPCVPQPHGQNRAREHRTCSHPKQHGGKLLSQSQQTHPAGPGMAGENGMAGPKSLMGAFSIKP